MAGSKIRKTIKENRKKKSASYNKTPKMPKDPARKVLADAFKPGVGGPWSAPVGKRDIRVASANKNERRRTFTDNWYQGIAADTRNIKKIGK